MAVSLSDFCNFLKVEMYEFLAFSCDSLNIEDINEFKPHIIVNCCDTTNLPEELYEILTQYDNSRIVHINLNDNYRSGSYSTYENWSCSEDRIITTLRRKLIITRRNEFGIPSPDFRQFKVLNCEDENSNFMMLKIILGSKVNLMRACDGIEAITICEDVSPDLILMDIRLPNMNGLDAARVINEVSGSRISIVALSAYAFDENIREALQAGMEAFLPKPFKPNDLVDTVTTVLEKNYILNCLSEK